MSLIVSASQEIASHFHAGMRAIPESATCPGTTDELVLPTLGKPVLEVWTNFFPALLIGGVDPGNPRLTPPALPTPEVGSDDTAQAAGRRITYAILLCLVYCKWLSGS
jgi:UDP-N-acetyl-D-glucosamine dehydrogenase